MESIVNNVLVKIVANYIIGEVTMLTNRDGIQITESKLSPIHLSEIAILEYQKVISRSTAKYLISTVWKNGGDVNDIVNREKLKQITDIDILELIVDKIFIDNTNQVSKFSAEKENIFKFLVGRVMKQTQGRGDVTTVQNLILKRLLLREIK